MAKYAEVKEKQRNVDAVREKEEAFGRGVWVGFTFKSKAKVNQGACARPATCLTRAAEVLGLAPMSLDGADEDDDDELLTLW